MRPQKLFFTLVIAALSILSAACQGLGGQNAAATLEANNNAFIAEATNIAVTANAYSTQLMATAQIVQTQVMQGNMVNQHLLATVAAGSTPTPRVIVGDANPSAGGTIMDNTTTGSTPVQSASGDTSGTQFTQIGTAAFVRDSDGCANGLQSQFSLDTTRVYITARAFNLAAGTSMSAEWSVNGTIVVTNSPWNVDQNYPDICVWFFISQDDVTFTPGDWTVRLLANGTPIEPAASFSIVGQ